MPGSQMHASKSSDESFKDSFPAISFGVGGVYSDIFSEVFFETSDFVLQRHLNLAAALGFYAFGRYFTAYKS
ncbi:MAG: hypothetical protein ACLUKN_10480 [Bacilli bacterium]